MPLRITHVDTKVLVLLVQAIPTSLHTGCSIPLTPKTRRQSRVMQAQICNASSSRSVRRGNPNFKSVLFKRLGKNNWNSALCIYRWRVRVSLHSEPPMTPLASENHGNMGDSEDPAPANGREVGTDRLLLLLLRASLMRTGYQSIERGTLLNCRLLTTEAFFF